MSKTVHAIYENGVFKPTEALDLPDQCQVEFEFRIVEENKAQDQALDEVYAFCPKVLKGDNSMMQRGTTSIFSEYCVSRYGRLSRNLESRRPMVLDRSK